VRLRRTTHGRQHVESRPEFQQYRSSSEAIVRETLDNRVVARQDASVSPVFGAGRMVRRRSAARKESMKAIVQDKYGSPDVLQLRDIDRPVVKDDEVLIRVHAAAVNIGDWHLVSGIPYVMRLGVGLRKPKREIPGLDIAGRVDAVGMNVSQLRPGDEVFGWCRGAFAEFACATEDQLLPKPANLTFEQSAAVGDSAFTALDAVRDQGKVQPGHRVLINGAAGGVGTFAVQIAKSLGANVTGVCSARNVDLVRSIGADQVVDYTHEDFTETEERYDVMLDLIGSRSLSDCRRALTPRGTYVLVGVADLGRWFGLSRQIKALLLSPFVRQRIRLFLVKHNREDLAVLKDLVEAGKIAPVIDTRYALSDVPEALWHQGNGHTQGKIVITV
jgi:NADPH:quinone reductase-like Zn-dependent oxidoreductase